MRRISKAAFLLSLLACMLRVAAEPVRLDHADLVLNGELTLAPQRGLEDGVVLILHGTLAHHDMELIATLRSLLAERGSSTLAVSLSLGVSNRRGMFDCAALHTHHDEDALEEIALWVQWLQSRGAKPIALLGHSRGGNQIARYAAAHPDEPAAVILIAPSTFDPLERRRDYALRYDASLDAQLAAAAALAPDAVIRGVPFLACGPSAVRAGTFLSYYRDDPARDTPRLLARIARPTLVIAGSADTVVPNLAERVRRADAMHAELVEIEGADHFFRDLYAEDVADAIAAFLARRTD